MMKKISYAILSTTLLASAAVASDATHSQPCAPASAFAGGYAGGKIGHSSSSMFLSSTIAPEKGDRSVPGITGGVFAGWGKEIGTSGLYGGVELTYLLSNDTYNERAKVNKGNTLELAFRLGVVKNENILLYAKAGYVNTKFEVTPSANNLKKLSKFMNGALVGAGIDVAWSKHVILGMDYTYAMYGKQKHEFQSTTAGNPATLGTLKPTSHVVTFRVAYRF